MKNKGWGTFNPGKDPGSAQQHKQVNLHTDWKMHLSQQIPTNSHSPPLSHRIDNRIVKSQQIPTTHHSHSTKIASKITPKSRTHLSQLK